MISGAPELQRDCGSAVAFLILFEIFKILAFGVMDISKSMEGAAPNNVTSTPYILHLIVSQDIQIISCR